MVLAFVPVLAFALTVALALVRFGRAPAGAAEAGLFRGFLDSRVVRGARDRAAMIPVSLTQEPAWHASDVGVTGSGTG